MNSVRLKIWKSARLFDANRGSAYSFICKVTQSVLLSAVAQAWHQSETYCQLDAESAEHFSAPDINSVGTDDITERIRRGIKTTATNPSELAAQRWYFQSLVASEFVLRRHQMANAAMTVFSLGHDAARRLYDMVILEARRVLLDHADRRIPMVPPQMLVHTRNAGLIRYRRYLSERDFSRLVCLLKDLPPALILTVKPNNACAIRSGYAELTRENLRLVLDGDPAARPLFH